MAFPTQITTDAGIATAKPFVSSADAVYIVTGSSGGSVWKATDPETAFVAVETIPAGTVVRGVCQVGDVLHIVTSPQIAPGRLAYFSFDMSTDTWIVEDEEIVASASEAYIVAMPGTTDIVVVYGGAVERIMGTDYRRVRYARRTTSWVATAVGFDPGGQINYTAGLPIPGTGRLHLHYVSDQVGGTETGLWQRSLSNAYALGTKVSVHNISTAQTPLHGVSYDVSGTARVLVAYIRTLSTGHVARYASAATPTVSVHTNPSGRSALSSHSQTPLAGPDADGLVYYLYRDDTDLTLAFYRTTADHGATWGAETALFDESSNFSFVDATLFTRDGIERIGFTYRPSIGIWYSELSLASDQDLDGAETGAGVDASTLAVALTGADTGTGVDDSSLSEGEAGDNEGDDTGTGSDDSTLGLSSPGEAGSGVEASILDKTEAGPGVEAGTAVDLASLSKWLGELPSPAPVEVPALIRYDGIDITTAVVITSARFTSSSNGRAGVCNLRIRDDGHVADIVQGRALSLDIGAVREWSGFVASVRRGYWFNSAGGKAPAVLERYFDVTGVDLSILFQKRVLYDKVDPTKTQLSTFPAGTNDSEILLAYMASHLDLSGDGLGTSLIETVGTPSIDAAISGAAGWRWDDLMKLLTRNVGSLYYIDPDGQVVLTDVDTPNAPFGISDVPGSGEVGCRSLEIDSGAEAMVNDMLAWGVGQGFASPVFSRVPDEASIALHGRWQRAAMSQLVWRQETIDRIADSHVNGSPQNKRGGKDDAVAVRCIIFAQGIRVGMKVPVSSDVFGFADVLPVRQATITFPVPTAPQYELVLSHEIDTPWTTFEYWWPDFTLPDFDFAFPDFDLFLPSFDPCFEGAADVIDDFNRNLGPYLGGTLNENVDLGSSALGPWAVNWTADTDPEGSSGVDGDSLFFSGQNTVFASISSPAYDTSNSIETIDLKFKYSREPAAPGFLELIVGWEEDDSVGEMDLFISPPGELYGLVSLNGDLTSDTIDKNDWVIDGFYRVKLERNGTTGELRGKLWLDDDPEPDWQFSATCSTPTPNASVLRVVLDNESAFEDIAALYRWDVDFIHGADPCASADPGEFADPPRSGDVCEELDPIAVPSGENAAHTFYETRHRYVPGSERVYRAGLLLRPGVDYVRQAVDRWIELLADDETDSIYVCYDIFLSTPAPELL